MFELGQPQSVYVRQKFPEYSVQTIYPNHYLQLWSMVCSSGYEDLAQYKIVEFAGKNVKTDSHLAQLHAAPFAAPRSWSVLLDTSLTARYTSWV